MLRRLVDFVRRQLSRLHPRRLRASWRWLVEVWEGTRRRRRDPRLSVAVDVTPFWEPLTGVGWYLHRLLGELAGREDLALRLYGPTLLADPASPPRVELPGGPETEAVVGGSVEVD